MVELLKDFFHNRKVDKRVAMLERECRLIAKASYIDDDVKSQIILDHYKMIAELQNSKSNSTSSCN